MAKGGVQPGVQGGRSNLSLGQIGRSDDLALPVDTLAPAGIGNTSGG